MKKMKKIKYALFIFCWFLAVIIFAASIAATQNLFLYNTINSVLGGERRKLVSGNPKDYTYYEADYDSKSSVLSAANELNERIAEEGVIMLKNENSLPLSEGSKISVFGKNSVNLVYGGSGSGGSSSSGAVTLEASLKAAGFEINPVLKSFYEGSASGSSRPKEVASMGDRLGGLSTYETPWTSYNSTVTNSFNEYSDAALVVVSRVGGEGFDLPRTMYTGKNDKITTTPVDGARSGDDHYLQLDKNEAELIKQVGERFDNVILIINCSTPMELGFLDDPSHYAYSENLKGALWIGTPGKTGINALGRVLSGEVNPSGRTVDTFARDFKQDPTWHNFGNNNVNNGNRYTVNGSNKPYYFVDYEEGIYVGYRYWETRGFTDGEDWYNEHVVFPLGYGLSYSTFKWEIVDKPAGKVTLNADTEISVKVKVTNTSQTPGKDVVQVYYEAPYEKDGIEKSSVVLAGFAKTKMLGHNESDTVTITFNAYDMASYDYSDANTNKFKGYELEAGDYKIKVSNNAHDAVDTITYHLETGVKYTSENTPDGVEVVNRFDDVSSGIKVYLSRSNWDGTFPKTPTAQDRDVTQEFISSLKYVDSDEGKKWETDDLPTQSKNRLPYSKAEVKLYELIGRDWDDPLWDKLLSQLTVGEMAELIGSGNYHTMAIDSISKPKTLDADGPVGFTPFMGDPSIYNTCFYASGCVIAATYNVDLAFEMGKMVGNEGLIGNAAGDKTPYSGWYAPGVNLHRSPFGGRNWEYYSEDGLLSGKIASGVIKGAMSKGVYTYVKHFALNDQETSRTDNGYLTWANEQSMRELYFKPFELAVKEGGTTAIMSSFNRIGTVWAGGSYELLTEVLRDEWGFRGMVITDYNLYAHMPANQMIKAGGDLVLQQDKRPSTTETPTQVTALRNAAHNILYTVANSNAMNGYGAGVIYKYQMPIWVALLVVLDVVVALAILGYTGWFVYGELKSRGIIKGFPKRAKKAADGEADGTEGNADDGGNDGDAQE